MNRNRLLWACRRGMLELDLLLGPFVESHYEHLSDTDKLAFEVLLEQEDQVLYQWLLSRQMPPDESFCRIVDIILAVHCKSASGA
ncbi:MAG: response regulator receiver protein [Porticoccaceae bacterium]|nr:response regulator receiver protein [Porticoccaceae bacterium]